MHLSIVFFLAAQAALFVAAQGDAPTIKWTLHSTCYNQGDLKDKIIKSMATVKSRAKLGTKIDNILGNDYKTAAKVIAPDRDTRVALSKNFALQAGLDGPIGADKNYADSPDWKTLTEQEDAYKKLFVIYCAPHVDVFTDDYNNKNYILHAEGIKVRYGAPLTVMYEDGKAKKWRDPNKAIMAQTSRYNSKLDDIFKANPKSDLAKFPESITFSEVYINTIREKNNGLDVMTDDLLKQLTSDGAWDLVKEKIEQRKKDNPNMDDDAKTAVENTKPFDLLLNSIESTLHHETFHLTAYGRLNDEDPAYGWYNNQKSKNPKNPDYYAIVGLILELLDQHKIQVNENGELSYIKS